MLQRGFKKKTSDYGCLNNLLFWHKNCFILLSANIATQYLFLERFTS